MHILFILITEQGEVMKEGAKAQNLVLTVSPGQKIFIAITGNNRRYGWRYIYEVGKEQVQTWVTTHLLWSGWWWFLHSDWQRG